MTSTSRPSCVDVIGRHGIHAGVLAEGVEVFFTGSALDEVEDANLAHHVPHVPSRLAAARRRVAHLTATDHRAWTMMRQVHGASVGVVDRAVPPGAEVRGVDILVTALEDRPLVVLSADCLPILAAGRTTIAAAHAGWRGIVADVPGALVAACVRQGEEVADLRVVIGPAIGPCCYAVGGEVLDAVGAIAPRSPARTRDGSASVDLRRAAHDRLAELGVVDVMDLGGPDAVPSLCTACDERWSSHRRDAAAARQAALIVRRSVPDTAGTADAEGGDGHG